MSSRRNILKSAAAAVAVAAGLTFAGPVSAQDTPGVTDTEIKIGHIGPYSGPASAYSLIGHTLSAYFKMINEQGGINGRQVNFISYDDGYAPPKAVEQVRKLVESDEVLLVFQPLGTPSNVAIRKYMNSKQVPQLFVATGATQFANPEEFPWTMGWQPNYHSEGVIYARWIMENMPEARIGVMYQNDDFGEDVLGGLKDGLGDKASMIVAEAPYEVSEPTVDSQIVKLKASGADLFINIATPKFAAQAIKKSKELGWEAKQIVANVSSSVGSVLKPAGLENAKGLLSTGYLKESQDPQWKEDQGMKDWNAFMDKYMPDADRTSSFTVYGYSVADTLVRVLQAAGDDLSRENVMKQAASMKDVVLPLFLPGMAMNTSETDFAPIEQMQIMEFDGERWVYIGEVISADAM